MSVLNLRDVEDLIYFILEMILAITEMLALLRFYHKAYGPPKLNRTKLSFAAEAVIVAVTFAMRISQDAIRPAAAPPVTVLCSLLFLAAYRGDRQKKALYSIVLLTVSSLWLLTWDLITSPIPIDQKYPLVVILTEHLTFCALVETARKLDRSKPYKIPGLLWLLLAAITVLSMASLTLIEYYVLRQRGGYPITFEIPVMIVLIFINMSLFVFFNRFSEMMQTEWENGFLAQQLALKSRHYETLEASQREIRKLHHDMKNYMQTAVRLADQEDGNAELKAFLRQACGQLQEASQIISTGNGSLDSILNIKLDELRRSHCPVELDIHIPPGLKLTFEQAVTIMGNLLDNAAEALSALPPEARWCRLHLSYSSGALFIRVENAARPVEKWKDGLPVTTKGGGKFHGLGLKNVKAAVEPIGTMEVSGAQDSFTVKILLYDR